MYKPDPKALSSTRPEETTAKSREIGTALRRAREEVGLNQVDICRTLDWGAPRVSRMESGQREGSTMETVTYLARIRTAPKEFNRLKRLSEIPANGYDLQRHPVGLHDRLPTLEFLHASAKKMTFYEPQRIPSLLQTERYAEAVLRRDRDPKDPVVTASVRSRMARQDILKNARPGFDATFYIDEIVLRDTIMHEIMEEQLINLTIAECLPHCHVHIIPTSCFDYEFSIPFSFFDDFDDNSVLTIHTASATLIMEDREDMVPYLRKLEKFHESALSGHQSTQKINSIYSTADRAVQSKNGIPLRPHLPASEFVH
ncbi:helix-turn-helix transcriptional regulator [Amycolatopsis sp. NPDC051071]|uniref:helix-turn-helix domain-containing protein n=1 Tax=Amycolatopsis sp. NPDC051071 TaxID=3154637 RepID=UPI00343CB57B